MENDFDLQGFFVAVDTRRRNEGLSWSALAAEVWALSHDLSELRGDHPISPATLRGLSVGRGVSCQHALFILRWLGVPPEAFVPLPHPNTLEAPLPQADKFHRLRWNLRKLYKTLDAARTKRAATWQQTASLLQCTPSQLTGLRSAKFATSMVLAMRIAQALHLPAAHFVDVAQW